jgi:CRISPR-associated protein Cas2
MSTETRRYMRVIIFFDLPTHTKKHRKYYRDFRRFLLKDGYTMIQFSVYGRLVNNFDDAEKHVKRLEQNKPPEGSVRCLQVTEKQFAAIKILVGGKNFQEKKVNSAQLLLF